MKNSGLGAFDVRVLGVLLVACCCACVRVPPVAPSLVVPVVDVLFDEVVPFVVAVTVFPGRRRSMLSRRPPACVLRLLFNICNETTSLLRAKSGSATKEFKPVCSCSRFCIRLSTCRRIWSWRQVGGDVPVVAPSAVISPEGPCTSILTFSISRWAPCKLVRIRTNSRSIM